MDFLSRDSRPAPQAHHTGHPPQAGPPRSSRRVPQVGGRLIAGIVAVLLIIAALWLLSGKLNGSESGELNKNRYQAVFLTNNQVYFGKITDISGDFFVLKDVFYIETPQSQNQPTDTSNSNYTLRKLGTNELHSPEDKMVINRDQVTFWENLKDNGQVVTKIKEYKSNPDAANQQQSGGTQQNQPTQQNNSTQPTDGDTNTTP